MSANVPASFVQVGNSINVLATSLADQGFGATLEVGAKYYVVAGKPAGDGTYLSGNFYGNTAGIGVTSANAKRRTDAMMFDDYQESGVFSRATAGNAGRFTFSGVTGIDAAPMNWGGVYHDDHIYGEAVVATDQHFGVVFRDTPITDNSGYITLTLYKQTLVKVTATDATGSEDARDPAVFTIERESASQSQPLSVYFSLGGTATASTQPVANYTDGITPPTDSSDYTVSGATFDAASGFWKAEVPAGQSSAAVTVVPLNDYVDDGPESVLLALESDPAGSAALYAAPASNPATKPAHAEAVINGLKLTATLPDPFGGAAATDQQKAQVTALYDNMLSDEAPVRQKAQDDLISLTRGNASLVPFVKAEMDRMIAAEDQAQRIQIMKNGYDAGNLFWQPVTVTLGENGALTIQTRTTDEMGVAYDVASISLELPAAIVNADAKTAAPLSGNSNTFRLVPLKSGDGPITVKIVYKKINGDIVSTLRDIIIPISIAEVKN
jgi:hypothetical protein